MIDIFAMLKLAKSAGASDLHLTVGNMPVLRINGSLQHIEDIPSLRVDDLEQALTQLTTSDQRDDFYRDKELDFGGSAPEVGRIRCNASFQRGSISIVIRLLPWKIPSIDELGIPSICKDLIVRPRGLIIISGPTGSGKTTTQAAMINYLNKSKHRRVVTVEDPIEFVHNNKKCAITQREVGSDTSSFGKALRHVLRQDPDVILVGEMRDLETAAAALTIAETGHLIITTGHAPSATQALERTIDLFPPHERHLAQTRLASLLLGVLCQALVPKADGTGRVAAVEVLIANTAVSNLIRESKIYQIPNVIRTHGQLGMILFDHSLVKLYQQGIIDHDRLLDLCNDKDEVEKLVGEVVNGGPMDGIENGVPAYFPASARK